MLDVESLRASMRGQLEQQRGPAMAHTTGGGEAAMAAAEAKPSGFSILQDSLKRDIEGIHRATRLSLPTMATAQDDDDDDDEGEGSSSSDGHAGGRL